MEAETRDLCPICGKIDATQSEYFEASVRVMRGYCFARSAPGEEGRRHACEKDCVPPDGWREGFMALYEKLVAANERVSAYEARSELRSELAGAVGLEVRLREVGSMDRIAGVLGAGTVSIQDWKAKARELRKALPHKEKACDWTKHGTRADDGRHRDECVQCMAEDKEREENLLAVALESAYREGAKNEREQCEDVARKLAVKWLGHDKASPASAASVVGDAIRALGVREVAASTEKEGK